MGIARPAGRVLLLLESGALRVDFLLSASGASANLLIGLIRAHGAAVDSRTSSVYSTTPCDQLITAL